MRKIVGWSLVALGAWAGVYGALLSNGVPDGFACLGGVAAEMLVYQGCVKPAVDAFVSEE